jgi:hypothetical protein
MCCCQEERPAEQPIDDLLAIMSVDNPLRSNGVARDRERLAEARDQIDAILEAGA